MSPFPAFRSRHSPDDSAPSTPDGKLAADELHADVFNLIPPRVEEPDRPTFERPYGLHRPVDLDVAALEAVRAQREAEIAATALPSTSVLAPETHTATAVAGPVAATPAATGMPSDAVSKSEAPTPAVGRNKRPVDGMDLARLSIDNDGRLYWDGKPVEVQRRLLLSRRQSAGVALIGALILLAALGSALQGAAVVHDWNCRLGWVASICADPGAPPASRVGNFPT